MSLRRTGRRWVTFVTVALCGCNLNPHGEDPGFEESPGFESNAGDEVIDKSAGDGSSTQEMPAAPNGSPSLGEGPDEIIDDPTAGAAPDPRPSEPSPVEPEQEVGASPIDAGALPDGGLAEPGDAGAPRGTDPVDVPTRPVGSDAGDGGSGGNPAERGDAGAPGVDQR